MSKLKIERIGGLAGFGGQNSHLQSKGEIETDELSEEDKKAVEDLFLSNGKAGESLARDTFRCRISRMTSKGMETIETDEENVPNTIRQSLRDELI